MLPTFLIAGVGKAGTTSLYTYLGQHPDVCMSSVKEPLFFTAEPGLGEGASPEGPAYTGQFSRGLDWYTSLFAHCDPDNARGEASGYLERPDAPSLISRTIPSIRLIFILRNPIDRAYSHYWQTLKKGESLPPFDLGVRTGNPRVMRFLHISAYAQHLERFYEEFDARQILLLLFDDMVQNPYEVLRRAFEHIGVEPSFTPVDASRPMNPAAVPRSRTLQRTLRTATRFARETPMPAVVRDQLRGVGRTLKARNMRGLGDVSMEEDTRANLRDLFRADVRYLERRLGRDLSHWE